MCNTLRYQIYENNISITFTINVGSLIRLAIMSHYGRQNNNNVSRTLAGKDSNGMPLYGHEHVFYIPTDDDCDGYIDHITIMTDTKLTILELDAVKAVDEIYSKHDNIRAHVILCDNINEDNSMMQEHKKWISKTPFVLNRHTKIRGNKVSDTPKNQVELELKRRYPLYKIINVVVKDNSIPMHLSKIQPKEFKRIRKPNEKPMPGYEVMLEFSNPVSGPLFLGYGCHFGLGMFVPYEE